MPPKPERFELRIDQEQLSQIDAWASEQSGRPARAEAVRRLINLGLAVGSRRAVRFSDGEKMLILMMRDLYKRLEINNAEADPDFLAEVIFGGHYWAPKWTMDSIFHESVDDPADVEYVVDVLDMWSFMEEVYAKFTAEQIEQIAKEVGPRGNNVEFPGFDGNNECSQLSIADFLINKMDRFTRFKGRSLNSHHQTYDRYCRMVELFKPMRATFMGHGLSVQQVITLLNA